MLYVLLAHTVTINHQLTRRRDGGFGLTEREGLEMEGFERVGLQGEWLDGGSLERVGAK